MQVTILAKTTVAFAILVGSAILPCRAHAQIVAQATVQADGYLQRGCKVTCTPRTSRCCRSALRRRAR